MTAIHQGLSARYAVAEEPSVVNRRLSLVSTPEAMGVDFIEAEGDETAHGNFALYKKLLESIE